ncbi:MAG TPA: hypothetical protein DC006_04875 [Prevotellaceae bacterium]|nr:hypothetical protein [Prevotellaceae bacterium]HBE55010.1 hypothetical protein [Prevotellaceae bacterium]
MDEKKNGWGGKREGSGRKRVFAERVTLNSAVSAEARAMLDAYAASLGISRNAALERLIREHCGGSMSPCGA